MPSRADQIAALSLPLAELPDPLPIPVIERPFDVTIRPPGSKSITNRTLLLAALADGTSELRGPLIDADDAQVMLRAIQQLGAKVEIHRGGLGLGRAAAVTPGSAEAGLDVLRVTGVNGRWKISKGQTVALNLNNAGTATRFLTAAAILAPQDSGGIIIDGDARMRERPIGELAEALEQLGVRVTYLGKHGYPPLQVAPYASESPQVPVVEFGVTSSSQFISAMLLTAPFLPAGMRVRIPFVATSGSYIHMTLRLMDGLGMGDLAPHAMRPWLYHDDTAPHEYHMEPTILPQRLRHFELDIEADASGAAYFTSAAALVPNAHLKIAGLPDPSLQGDALFSIVLCGMMPPQVSANQIRPTEAYLVPIDIGLELMPDTAMTAAVLACFATPTPDNPTATSILRGLRTLRVKETDRLAALQTELSKLGADVEIFQDGNDEGLRITPPPPPPSTSSLRHSATPPLPLLFDTYNDHRMAMSLALIGLRRPNTFIRNPACVAKTYPTFWQDLARLYEPRTK